MIRLFLRFQTWWNRLGCLHHWHSADAMILWRCCYCHKDADGHPVDRTEICLYEWASWGQPL